MRKVILSMMVSVDGFIQAKDPNYNWHNWDQEMTNYMMDFFKTADTFLYGRKAYQDMIAYWPSLNDEFARVMNCTPKLVFSRTLETVNWSATLISENALEAIKKEKTKAGKDMALFGGGEIANFFMNNNLIDEFRLIINPVILGGGEYLFGKRDEMKNLKLKETVSFKCGNTILIYEPKN